MKIMVIDGNSIINRAYHGIRPLSNHEGTPTNAVYGFLSTLFKQQDEERPDRTVVCFDVKEKTFRHLKFDTYKATRKPMDEELAVQMPIVKEVLDALGIVRSLAEKEIIFAEKVVREIDDKKAKGIGVFTVDGKMIDIAFYDGAKRTLAMAKAAGVYKGDL